MEATAIILLAVIVVLGSAVFMVFLQFLAVNRENKKLYQRIMEEINALGRQVDGLSRAAGPEKNSDQID